VKGGGEGGGEGEGGGRGGGGGREQSQSPQQQVCYSTVAGTAEVGKEWNTMGQYEEKAGIEEWGWVMENLSTGSEGFFGPLT
jgi:hypothetical protein